MATKRFMIFLQDFGECWLVPGETVYYGRLKHVLWSLRQKQSNGSERTLISVACRPRSTRATILRELSAELRAVCRVSIQ